MSDYVHQAVACDNCLRERDAALRRAEEWEGYFGAERAALVELRRERDEAREATILTESMLAGEKARGAEARANWRRDVDGLEAELHAAHATMRRAVATAMDIAGRLDHVAYVMAGKPTEAALENCGARVSVAAQDLRALAAELGES